TTRASSRAMQSDSRALHRPRPLLLTVRTAAAPTGPGWLWQKQPRQRREHPPPPAPALAASPLSGADQDLQFVLETARFDRAMHAAFFGSTFFPPPATRAGIGPGLNWPGARRTTNALIALVVQ